MDQGANFGFFYAAHGKQSEANDRQEGSDNGNRIITDWFNSRTFEELILLTLDVSPNQLRQLHWKYSLNDYRVMTNLKVQHEIIKAMSITESLFSVAAALFPADKSKPRKIESLDDVAQAMAKYNGRR